MGFKKGHKSGKGFSREQHLEKTLKEYKHIPPKEVIFEMMDELMRNTASMTKPVAVAAIADYYDVNVENISPLLSGTIYSFEKGCFKKNYIGIDGALMSYKTYSSILTGIKAKLKSAFNEVDVLSIERALTMGLSCNADTPIGNIDFETESAFRVLLQKGEHE